MQIDTDTLAYLIFAELELSPEMGEAARALTRLAVTVSTMFPEEGHADRFMNLAMLGRP